MPAGFASGFYAALMWYVGPNGYFYGQWPDLSQHPNATAEPWIFRRVKTANLAYIDPTQLDITGGDKTLTSFQFGNAKLNKFELAVADVDPAMMSGLSLSNDVPTFNTFWDLVGTNSFQGANDTFGIALIQRFAPTVIGASGPDMYHTLILPRCHVRVKYRSMMAYGAESGITFEVTTMMSDRDPHGTLFSSAGIGMGWEGDVTDHYSVFTPYPISFVAGYQNVGHSTMLWSQSAALYATNGPLTLGASPYWFARNGTQQALTSVSAANLVSFSSSTQGDLTVLQFWANPRLAMS